jgi:hypothetical protein
MLFGPTADAHPGPPAAQHPAADNLLELFAAEGQAQVSVGDQPLEATSHRVALPGGGERFVVLLRQAGGHVLSSGDEPNMQALRVVADISHAVSVSLDPAETYEAVLANLSRAFRFSLAELNLWDAAAQVLRPARHSGDRDYVRDLALVGNITPRARATAADRHAPPAAVVDDVATHSGAPQAVRRLPFCLSGAPARWRRLVGTLNSPATAPPPLPPTTGSSA